MGGHERCRKTSLWGMTCLLPHYALLCVCAAGGLGRMTREHLAVAVALEGEWGGEEGKGVSVGCAYLFIRLPLWLPACSVSQIGLSRIC